MPIATTTDTTTTVLDTIGDTPLLQVDGIWAKLEFFNPSGSVKARIAKYMIEQAEAAGQLRPGQTIVEATSGNTGNALSMVAAVKGYDMLVVIPRGLSSERTAISRSYGAKILEVGDFHVTEALETALELGQQPGYYCPQQFKSAWNVEENRRWLGPEIIRDLGRVPDALVMGVGTGGTLLGAGQAFRDVNPQVKLIAVEPAESCTLQCGETGCHAIEGIADGFVPDIVERHGDLIDEVIAVPSDDAIAVARELAQRHGLLVGPSSGAHLFAARRVRDTHPRLGTIVTVFADEGEKYLSTATNEPG